MMNPERHEPFTQSWPALLLQLLAAITLLGMSVYLWLQR
jgi:hypothetical protein